MFVFIMRNSKYSFASSGRIFDENFVGNNRAAAGYYLVEKQYTFINPCNHCSNHLFPKILIPQQKLYLLII